MNHSLHTLAPRLLAGFGTAALVAGVGLFASSRPAHTAGGPIAVNVANLPVPTTDADNPGRTPFAQRLDLAFTGGDARQSFTVPAHKRLVLTYVSADCGVPHGVSALLDIATTVNGAEVEAHPPLIPQGSLLGEDVLAAGDPVTIYADPGSTVTVAAIDGQTAGSAGGGLIVGLYGYLVNTP